MKMMVVNELFIVPDGYSFEFFLKSADIDASALCDC